jgi:hypothetical protein
VTQSAADAVEFGFIRDCGDTARGGVDTGPVTYDVQLAQHIRDIVQGERGLSENECSVDWLS